MATGKVMGVRRWLTARYDASAWARLSVIGVAVIVHLGIAGALIGAFQSIGVAPDSWVVPLAFVFEIIAYSAFVTWLCAARNDDFAISGLTEVHSADHRLGVWK